MGGDFYVMHRDGSAEGLHSVTIGIHFTTFGCIAHVGEPVMCAVIMRSKTPILPSWVMGIDCLANIVDAETEDKFVLNNNKFMSSNPTCLFRGNEVPCIVIYSTKASITSIIMNKESVLSYC